MFAVVLVACSPDRTDLKSLDIPGVEPFDYRDESSLPLSLTTTGLAHDFVAKGAAQGADGQMLAADATTSNEAIAQAVDRQLGSGWQRSTGFQADKPLVHVMVWETTRARPKRFYAIAAYAKVQTSTEGRQYRPMESVFSRQ